MQAILAFINSFFSSIWGLFKFVLSGLFTVLSAFVYMIFDGFLTVVYAFVSALDLSALAFNHFAQWSNLPPQAIYFINQLALPQCASLIASAILIRMLLNLIPAEFTRL